MKNLEFFFVIVFQFLSICDCQNGNFGLDFDALLNCWHIKGLGISLVHKGEIISQQGYGESDQNGTKVNVNTGFHVGSLTKAFTATTTVIASKKFSFSLQSPIDNDKDIEFDAVGILSDAGTMIDILAHRLGIENSDLIWLANQTSLKEEKDLNELVKRMSAAYESFRSDFFFNNIMYWVIGIINKMKTKIDWCTLLNESIFRPLHMNTSFCSHEGSNGYPISVANHFIWNNETQMLELLGEKLLSRWDDVAAGEGIVSTVYDMTTWMLYNLNTLSVNANNDSNFLPNSLKETKLLKMVIANAPSIKMPKLGIVFNTYGYGLGWFIGTYRGLTVNYHQGSVLGHKSLIWLVPDIQLGIFISVTGGDEDVTQNLFLLMHYLTDLISNRTGNIWFQNINELCNWTTENVRQNYFYPSIIPTHFDQLYSCNCHYEENIQLKECENRENIYYELKDNGTISDEYLGKIFTNKIYGNLQITQCSNQTGCNRKTEYCITFGSVSGYLVPTNLTNIFYICPKDDQLIEIQKTQFVRPLLIKLQKNRNSKSFLESKINTICGLTLDQNFPPLFAVNNQSSLPLPIVFILLAIFIFGNIFSSRKTIVKLARNYYAKARAYWNWKRGKIEEINSSVYNIYENKNVETKFENKISQSSFQAKVV